MDFPCRSENCKKSFSTKSNRNKHEKLKNHGSQLEEKTKIPFFDTLYRCPANGCDVESKYKYNIVKHLKICVELKKRRNTVANSKVCPVCSKAFAQKSNRDRNVKNFYQDSENDIVIDNQRDENMQNETIPSMALAINIVPPKVSPSLPPEVPVPNDMNPEENVLPPND